MAQEPEGDGTVAIQISWVPEGEYRTKAKNMINDFNFNNSGSSGSSGNSGGSRGLGGSRCF